MLRASAGSLSIQLLLNPMQQAVSAPARRDQVCTIDGEVVSTTWHWR
jgi:hypothetical protein